MKSNVVIYFALAVFFAIFAVIYPTWNFFGEGRVEWVGNVAITLTMIMFLLLGGFLFLNLRRQGGVLPEDSEMADIDDGDTEQGYFLPWSWWPFFAGAAGGVAMLSMAIGPWLALFALGLVLITFIGWFFEPFRGAYRR
ncbi:MAG: cytochrome c oxidase subunit 4 [Microbacteriaceae bacterium]